MAPRLRTTFLLGVLAGLVVALVRLLGREGRSAPASLGAPAPALPPAPPTPVAAPEPAPVVVEEVVAAEPAPLVAEDPVAPEPVPASEPEPGPDAPVAGAAEPLPFDAPAWVAPVDGGCPEGYPIKAKESSRIFHRPGGLSYDRTRPDRCYADAAAAEADGFRAAKR
jgi:hypothetical protein